MDKKEIIKIIENNDFKIKENIEIIDTDDYITSRIDGTKRKRIYGKYLNKFKITSEQYLILFPNAPLYCKNDKNKTSIKSGDHMKKDNYKKLFSDKIKGELNPNHKSKSTEKQRKERSPFSIDFYLNNNTKENAKKLKNDFVKKVSKLRIYNTRKDFYKSEKEYKKRQSTFSYKKCIQKYGKNKGEKIFVNRQIKWHNSLKKNMKCGYSKTSQELFDILKSKINYNNLYYATFNNEYYIKRSDKKGIWKIDFTLLDKRKIIEYNGDLYHANPKIYNDNDKPHPFKKETTSKEIWEKDQNKYNDIINNNFEILIIWDSDYKKNKEFTINKCLEFLK